MHMQRSRNGHIGNDPHLGPFHHRVRLVEARLVENERPLHFLNLLEKKRSVEVDFPLRRLLLAQLLVRLRSNDRVQAFSDDCIDDLRVDDPSEVALAFIDLDGVLSIASPAVHAVRNVESHHVLLSLRLHDDSAISQKEGILNHR